MRLELEIKKLTLEQNYRVSLANFQWFDSGFSEIAERAAARHCRHVGTLGSLREQLGDAP